MMMKHRILAYCDHQNSVTCMMGCIFTMYSIAFHVCKSVCKRAQRYPMVDFLTGHRLGTDISSEYRLTGQVLFPNSKNSSIMYETLSNLLCFDRAISSWKPLRCSIRGCISLLRSTVVCRLSSLSSPLDRYLLGKLSRFTIFY